MNVKLRSKIVRLDAKGRVTLGKLAEGASVYAATRDEYGRIILEPYLQAPAVHLPPITSVPAKHQEQTVRQNGFSETPIISSKYISATAKSRELDSAPRTFVVHKPTNHLNEEID